MSRFLSGGPITSVENHDRTMERTVERAIATAVEGLPLMSRVRGGTNPIPQASGMYDENDEYVRWEVFGDSISTYPLGP
jgi:hypothetical protein